VHFAHEQADSTNGLLKPKVAHDFLEHLRQLQQAGNLKSSLRHKWKNGGKRSMFFFKKSQDDQKEGRKRKENELKKKKKKKKRQTEPSSYHKRK
jgi:hypothetical protein